MNKENLQLRRLGENDHVTTFDCGVDTWVLVNNSETPRSIFATGGKDQETAIRNSYLLKKIEENVKR